MTFDWKSLADGFEATPTERAIYEARRRLKRPAKSDWLWLSEALQDERTMRFVAAVFKNYPVPKRLFMPFLRAAIRETNPSFCRQFVEPCVESYGHRRVIEYLLEIVEGNDNVMIAGAVAALYWTGFSMSFVAHAPVYSLEYATPASRAKFMELASILKRKRETFVRVFVSNEDVRVRQQIIPALILDENEYEDDDKRLVCKAIEIARTHDDEYIRHRVEVQLGNDKLLRPIPPRSSD